jgi:hypothetical protein
MRKQYSRDIAEDYEGEYESHMRGLVKIPDGEAFDMAIDEIERLDTLADFWFMMAEIFDESRKHDH